MQPERRFNNIQNKHGSLLYEFSTEKNNYMARFLKFIKIVNISRCVIIIIIVLIAVYIATNRANW